MENMFEEYKPLDESLKEIRLIRILADTPSSTSFPDVQISCQLETVRLDQANPYFALSYVWGAGKPVLPLRLNDQVVYLRQNLWTFLAELKNRFCHPTEEGALLPRTIRVWADSLCINQRDLHERSYQVSLMGEIYRGADAVYAWLGQSIEGIDESVRFVEEVEQMRAQNRPWIQISKQCSSNPLALSSIATNPYWSRLWIKQEVILAKDLWIFCGKHVLSWRDVRFAATFGKPYRRQELPRRRSTAASVDGNINDSLSAPESGMTALLDMRASNATSFSLPDLVNKFRGAGCQDARDYIFALLALVDPWTRQQVDVDYSKPIFQIFLENYHLWAGEQKADAQDLPSRHQIFEHYSLCIHISRLLPPSEFALLCRSEEARRAVTTNGVFTISSFSELVSVQRIAVFNGRQVKPYSEETVSTRNSHHVLLMRRRASIAGPAKHREGTFVFASCAPRRGDLYARLGALMVFVRKAADGANESNNQLSFLGTGVEMETRTRGSLDDRSQLRNQSLYHPCRWHRQQMPDASFEILPQAAQSRSIRSTALRHDFGNTKLVCNAAGLLMILLHWTGLANSPMSGYKTREGFCELQMQDSESEGKLPLLWSPYDFGIQHHTLHGCHTCRYASELPPGGTATLIGSTAHRECRCHWITHGE